MKVGEHLQDATRRERKKNGFEKLLHHREKDQEKEFGSDIEEGGDGQTGEGINNLLHGWNARRPLVVLAAISILPILWYHPLLVLIVATAIVLILYIIYRRRGWSFPSSFVSSFLPLKSSINPSSSSLSSNPMAGGCCCGWCCKFFRWSVNCVVYGVCLGILIYLLCMWLFLSVNTTWMYVPDDTWVTKAVLLNFMPSNTSLGSRVLQYEFQLQKMRDSEFPLIFKPNICSTDSRNVRVVPNRKAAELYFMDRRDRGRDRSTIVQRYHNGTEASVYYYRYPFADKGVIKTIGLKKETRLAQEKDRVNVVGRAPFIRIRDDLITPQVVAFFDNLAKKVPGFHIGRFDVRYRSDEEFMQGRGIYLMELNQGVPIGDYRERNTRNGSYALDSPEDAQYIGWGNNIRQVRTFFIHVLIGVSNIVMGNAPGPLTLCGALWSIWQRGFECNSTEHMLKAIP